MNALLTRFNSVEDQFYITSQITCTFVVSSANEKCVNVDLHCYAFLPKNAQILCITMSDKQIRYKPVPNAALFIFTE